jgi:O-methyltransferase
VRVRTTPESIPVRLGELVRKLARGLYGRLPFTMRWRREAWINKVYWRFGQSQRKYVFLSIARFMHINRPIPGYYFEFGCNEANTIRMAWSAFRHLFDLTYVGFDSFEGLPEITEIDRQEIWSKGKLAFEEEEFIRRATSHGIPSERLITVKGFYENSLNDALRRRLGAHKAAVVYVDCDLYASTVPVLEFVKNFLQVGTVIVFDDWFCFHGDPEKGEQRAWNEFRGRYPQLRFADFVQTNEAKAFICTGT